MFWEVDGEFFEKQRLNTLVQIFFDQLAVQFNYILNSIKKMPKNTPGNSQKSADNKNARREHKKMKFQFEKSNLAPFISKGSNKIPAKSLRLSTSAVKAQNQNEHKNSIVALKKQQNKLSTRPKASSMFDKNYQSFNNKLLFLHYGNQDVYVDSIKKQGSPKSKSGSKSEESGEQQDLFLQYCIRTITQQTYHSSNGYSNPYTPAQSTPTSSSRFSYTQTPQQMYYYYQYPKQETINQAIRNRKSIPMEQSKNYMIEPSTIESDGRTTLMIRNIPNKYSQDMLLELFQENYKKKIDFFYLPIDSKNNCNVGYAFINFLHPKFILDFYQEFHLKKWNKFNSEKICNLCYARIQGTAQLSNHFEASRVLQNRQRRYRPLIGLNQAVFSNLSSIVQKQKYQSQRM